MGIRGDLLFGKLKCVTLDCDEDSTGQIPNFVIFVFSVMQKSSLSLDFYELLRAVTGTTEINEKNGKPIKAPSMGSLNRLAASLII